MANEVDEKEPKKDKPAAEADAAAAKLVDELGVISDEDLDGVSGGARAGGLGGRMGRFTTK
jgi:hypothetical protein